MDGLRIVQEDNVGNGTEQRKGLRAQRNARPKQNVCEECSCGLCKQASKQARPWDSTAGQRRVMLWECSTHISGSPKNAALSSVMSFGLVIILKGQE